MREVTTLTTERFTMRPLQRGDEKALFPTLSDPDQCLYLSREAFASEEELWDWLSDPTWPGRTWIAVDKTGDIAGRFVAMPAHADDVNEIGYITCANRQREGIARECMEALIEHLFATGLRKITAEVDTRNAASIRLLEALRFTREAHLREHEMTHIGICDVYWYGRLVTD